MLVITGPTGSGKTATLRVLCRLYSIEIREWINPIAQGTGDDGEYGPSQLSQFLDVISDSKYPSLFDGENQDKRIVLVEDFPNFVMRNASAFNEILM